MQVIAEVGVGHLGVAYGALLWDKPDVEILMFEPHPEYFAEIKAAAAGRSNVKLFNVAIGDKDGKTNLYLRQTSSYLEEINGQSVIDQGHPHLHREDDKVEVDIKTFDQFDPGNINYLRVDTEGGEWFVLKHLKSRPEVISIETHDSRAAYINPYLWEIEQWMGLNGYEKVNVDEMDTIYKKTGKVEVPNFTVAQNMQVDFGGVVAQFINATYYKYFFNALPPKTFAENLHKIYIQKQDVLDRLTAYIQAGAAKGRDIHRQLKMFDMFVLSLIKDIDRTDY